MAAEETSLPSDETEAARAVSSAAEPYDFALPVTPDELPPAEPPPILLSESWQKPKPPHPSFGWSILWCGLFLLVTQLIPGLGVGFVVFVVEIARVGSLKAGMDWLASPEGAEQFQKDTILPSI